MTQTYATRAEAIEREIIEPIEASGEVRDARAEFDIDAIAAEVLGDYADGYACLVDADEFWRIVERHARQHTVRLTSTNSPSVHDGETRYFDTLTVFLGDEEVAEVTVESSEDPEPYIAALQSEGWRVIDISGPDWIVEPAE